MANGNKESQWTKTIQQLIAERRLTSHQCILYNKTYQQQANNDEECGCQRPIRQHSFDEIFEGDRPKPKDWNVKEHTRDLDRLIYLSNPICKVLRCACENLDDIATLYDLMKSVCKQPKLIISVYGGRKHFTMSEQIEKEFTDSLAEAAMTSGTWIITSGLNSGAARLIGESINRFRALTDTKQAGTLLGMSWWGNVTEKTRKLILDFQREDSMMNEKMKNLNMQYLFDDNDEGSLERNHTHFLLLDDGKYESSYVYNQTNEQLETTKHSEETEKNINNEETRESSSNQQHTDFVKTTQYPKEIQRVDFVDYACKVDDSHAVTIIVEGGINTCVAVLSEIRKQRPVIFIQGSGKIADVVTSLMRLTAENDYTPVRLPTRDEIEHNLRRFPMRTRRAEQHENLIKQIEHIMQPNRRRYLTVFDIDSDLNLKQTICHAIVKAHYAQTDLYRINKGNDASKLSDEKIRKHSLRQLAIKWNCFEQAIDLLDELQYMNTTESLAQLFKQALVENRPAFVDYFLRINFDPRCTLNLTESKTSTTALQKESIIQIDSNDDIMTENLTTKGTIAEYQNQTELNKLGSEFVFHLYEKQFSPNVQKSTFQSEVQPIQSQSEDRLNMEYRKWIGNFMRPIFSDSSESEPIKTPHERSCCSYKWICNCRKKKQSDNLYKKLNRIIAVIPTAPASNLQEKISSGVLAKELTQEMLRDLLYWSIFSNRIDMAKVFILHIRTRICAALSCTAILRRRATKALTNDQDHWYTQQADDFEIYAIDCINACYAKNERKACELLIREQPLFGKITCTQAAISSSSKHFINTICFEQMLNRVWYNRISSSDMSFFWLLKFMISFLTFGIIAPYAMPYCRGEILGKNKIHNYYDSDDDGEESSDEQSPDAEATATNPFLSSQLSNAGINYYTKYQNLSKLSWKIYRKKFLDFHHCPMVKMCYQFAGYIFLLLIFSYIVLFKLVPKDKINHGTYDWTEIYVIITIFTMLIEDIRRIRDLFGFLYVAFICVAAYGVASRTMTKQDEVTFTIQSIFENIFYAPYWFLYADAGDERQRLDNIIASNKTVNLIPEAIATHVLLAFHMLFFNILLLNLLIAVFATTINKVENNAKYFYHYQRYILTQEYFEKPIIPIPPLILIWHLSIILRYIWYRLKRRYEKQKPIDKQKYHSIKIFKIIPRDPQFSERCTDFEHAATYEYARFVVEKKKEKNLMQTTMDTK